MIECIEKSLFYTLLFLSIIGLFFLIIKKRVVIPLFIAFCVLSRELFKDSSSRYYSVLLILGMYLALYAQKIFPNKLKYLLIFVIIFFHGIKTYCSFNNKYILDLQEFIDREERINNKNLFYVMPKEIDRLLFATHNDMREYDNTIYSLKEKKYSFMDLYVNRLSIDGFSHIIIDNSSIINDNPSSNDIVIWKKMHSNSNYYNTKNVEVYTIPPYLMSLSNNQFFLQSPQTINISRNILDCNNCIFLDDQSILFKGIRSQLFYQKKFIISDAPCNIHLKIKNVGNVQARIYIGFELYSNDNQRIDSRNYPYNGNRNLKVISSETGSNRIIVDSNTYDWKKKAYVVLENIRDHYEIPSYNFINGRVSDIIQNENGTSTIILDSILLSCIKKDSYIRINGPSDLYQYCYVRIIQPGKEDTVDLSLSRQNDCTSLSSPSIPQGVYFIKPFLFSFTPGGKVENTIQISDFSISF